MGGRVVFETLMGDSLTGVRGAERGAGTEGQARRATPRAAYIQR